MAKDRTLYVCRSCEYETGKWLGKCPSCGGFSTFDERTVVAAPTPSSARRSGTAQRTPGVGLPTGTRKALKLSEIDAMGDIRISTGIGEFDNVLSGGIVNGSLVLVGGDPGIGKSTLLLQICKHMGEANKRVLYVSGEESMAQLKMRAERLQVSTDNLFIISSTDMQTVEDVISYGCGDVSAAVGVQSKFDVVIIDSIQTMFEPEIASAQGSVSQVRECTQRLMYLAKSQNVPIFIVGHVTKDGQIAGPRILEHMVDTVLYFEGERYDDYRIIRAVKNRFGATNEIGVFEMRREGLAEIPNPSQYMLSGRPKNVPGSVITCSMEGSRPILAEVQALCSRTSFGTPRRTATGLDYNRVIMLLAVLEKRAGLKLSEFDSYVNIAGGMKIYEPSADVAIIGAVASSYANSAVDPGLCMFGEVGLTGELRAANHLEKRLTEARKLGFTQCVIPKANRIKDFEGVRVFGAANVAELLRLIGLK